MVLLRAIQICLYLYLLGAVEGSDLPKLPGNKLRVGKDRYLPGAVLIECGKSIVVPGIVGKSQTPSTVVTPANFGKYAFTAGPIGSPQSPKVTGIQSKFTYAEVTGKKTMHALQVDPSGEDAYWLPQGGKIDIPKVPSASQPKYVFTADFSGCSWTVTPMANGNLRLRHVEGDKEESQFNNLSVEQKGGDNTYAMQFMDYGYVVETTRLVESIRSFAYMHFDGTRWTLYLQRQTCSPYPGGYEFNASQLLSKMTMLDSDQKKYNQITGAKAYTIPSV